MLVKPLDPAPNVSDPRLRAGAAAERQMEFYLRRAFGRDEDVLVLNGLRLVDRENLFGDGVEHVCQVDHLVLHRGGGFVIESKSCVTGVRVRGDDAGNDEWETADARGRAIGLPSPLQQARRQAEFLRLLLNTHASELREADRGVLRLLIKLVNGTPHRGFRYMPLQIVVAIGDRGRVERDSAWSPPSEPFRTAVLKADHVAEFVRTEIGRHGASRLPGFSGEYGFWSLRPPELMRVGEFLMGRHSPASASPGGTAPSDSQPRCKSCSSENVEARQGRYGRFWKCLECGANTSMRRRIVR